MKRNKRLIILLAVLAVISAATFALSRYEQKQEQIKLSEQVLLEIPFTSVRSFSWTYAGEETGLGFQQDENGWSYQDDAAFPVSESALMNVIGHFSSFNVSFTIENVDNYSQYGLDEPDCTISIETEDSSYTMKLGDYSQMDQLRYIDIGDGNVYLAAEDPGTWLEYTLSDFLLHDDTPDLDEVVDVTFTGKENYTVIHQEDNGLSYSDEDEYLIDGSNRVLDSANMQEYLSTITALELSNFVTYNATEEELAARGLAEPELTVTVRYEDGKDEIRSCTLHIGSAEDPDNTDEQIGYIRVGDSSIIYQLESIDYAILSAAGYDDLRHQQLFWGDFSQVTQLDLTLEGKTHTLVYQREDANDDDSAFKWFYDQQIADITNVQSALEALSADSFTSESPSKDEEIGVTLHLDNENFPTVEIRLYRYDGSQCLAVVDGDPVSLVSRSSVMDLVEAVQAIVLN